MQLDDPEKEGRSRRSRSREVSTNNDPLDAALNDYIEDEISQATPKPERKLSK